MGNVYQMERLIHEKEVKREERVSNGEIDTRKEVKRGKRVSNGEIDTRKRGEA